MWKYWYVIKILRSIRYEIYLPIDDQIILRLNVYSANDKKKITTKELKSNAVQDLLNHIKVEVKK